MAGAKTAGSKKQSLGKVTALLLTAGMMVGSGIFTTLGAATAEAGSGILIAMLIGACIALLTGISAAQAGVNYPQEGGAFIWMRIFGYRTISFVAGVAYLVKGMVGLGIAALGFAYYSSQMFGGLSIPLAASVALLVVAAVNFFGVSPTAKVIISIFFSNLVLLLIFVGFSIPSVKVDNFTPLLGTGFTGILSGAAVFFWAWDGFQRTAIMADQIKNPRRTIPLAIVGGIFIAAVVYTMIAGTTLGVLGPRAMGRTDTPLFLAASRAIGGWGAWVIMSSACILAFSDILGDLMSTSKVGHAMGQEHELPSWLGMVHKQLKTPQLVIALLTVVGLLLVNFVPLRALVPVASACTLTWYIITHVCALKLNPDKRFAWPLLSWLGIALCAALLLALPRWAVGGAVVFLLVLLGIRWLVMRIGEKQAVDASGEWSVSGFTLAEGDIITVTAQYEGETASAKTTAIVAAAPRQTAAPVISRTVTAADSAVSGKASSGATVILSLNQTAQSAVIANGGNWTVSGLNLAQGDTISVVAHAPGEIVSKDVTTVVASAPLQAVQPIILGRVTEADTSVSGQAPSGAKVVLAVNGQAQPAVEANGGIWMVSGLNLSQGDSISARAQYAGDTVETETAKKVTSAPPKTAEPVIAGIVTAANTTISGKAPAGAKIVLSINGTALPSVVASACPPQSAPAAPTSIPAPPQTATPLISGTVKASDTTVSGTAPPGASVVLTLKGSAYPALVDAAGDWLVAGLTLSQGDTISVSAQCKGETISTPATTAVQ